MRSLRSGVAVAAIVAMWSSAAFGFNLFGSSDDSDKKPAPKPQAQVQQTTPQKDLDGDQTSIAKSLAANLDVEIEKAKTQRALGDLGGAAHALAQMMLVAPDDERVISEYGKVLVQLGRSDDAVAFLKRAIQLSPNDWTLYSAIGAAFDQESKFAEAQTAYQRGLEIKSDSAALLNNYAMSRMLAGDLPGAQALIARAQALGNDPKIAHNASLMASLRAAPQAAASQPVVAFATPVAKETPKAATPVAASQAALPKPVSTASLPPPAKPVAKDVRQAMVTPSTIAPAKPMPAAKPEPVKAAAIVKPEPVKAAPVATPAPVKTASLPAAEKPVIVKTETGPVMMQAIPKDSKAGPVGTAAEATKTETASAPETEASAPPRALAQATPESAHSTPDLRAAAD